MKGKTQLYSSDNKLNSWLPPKKAAQYIKEQNPYTSITEYAIRGFIKQGFPCAKINSKCWINVDTFDKDLMEHSRKNSIQTRTVS